MGSRSLCWCPRRLPEPLGRGARLRLLRAGETANIGLHLWAMKGLKEQDESALSPGWLDSHRLHLNESSARRYEWSTDHHVRDAHSSQCFGCESGGLHRLRRVSKPTSRDPCDRA